jgi:hypothetical protein
MLGPSGDNQSIVYLTVTTLIPVISLGVCHLASCLRKPCCSWPRITKLGMDLESTSCCYYKSQTTVWLSDTWYIPESGLCCHLWHLIHIRKWIVLPPLVKHVQDWHRQLSWVAASTVQVHHKRQIQFLRNISFIEYFMRSSKHSILNHNPLSKTYLIIVNIHTYGKFNVQTWCPNYKKIKTVLIQIRLHRHLL